jgi:hypothetical protein
VLSNVEVKLKKDLKARLLGLTGSQQWIVYGLNRPLAWFQLKHLKQTQNSFTSKQMVGVGKIISASLSRMKALCTHMKPRQPSFSVTIVYSNHFGTPATRDFTFNWEQLGLQRHDLSSLDLPFLEDEHKAVILDIASEKAPGPDGFIGVFFKQSWDTVKEYLLAAVNFFYQLHDQHLDKLNSAHLVLIPKKSDARRIGDFRPISLTHAVGKIISKLLTSRLAPELNVIVSRAQSAFIKRRSIQDNFLYTHYIPRT